MTARKVTSRATNSKSLLAVDVEHYRAVDWSQRTMAIADMGRCAVEPVVLERDADLKALKEYPRTLRGSTVLVIELTFRTTQLRKEQLRPLLPHRPGIIIFSKNRCQPRRLP